MGKCSEKSRKSTVLNKLLDPPSLKKRHTQSGQEKTDCRDDCVNKRLWKPSEIEKYHNDDICQNENKKFSRPAYLPCFIRFHSRISFFNFFYVILYFFKWLHTSYHQSTTPAKDAPICATLRRQTRSTLITLPKSPRLKKIYSVFESYFLKFLSAKIFSKYFFG